MNYKPLSTTNLQVSAVALGCMSLAPSLNAPEDIPEAQAVATVHAALDAGINFFDNAPAYADGVAEVRLGKALKGRRDKAVVATKILTDALTPAEVDAHFHASLKRLDTDYVDLYQIHWAKYVTPVEETLRAMERLVAAGKCRAVGVCNFGPVDFAAALATGVPLATNQLAYSLLFRAAEFAVRDLCIRHEVGILCYSPLAAGLLTGRYASADDVPAGRARTRHFAAATRPQVRHGQPGCEAETFEAVGRLNAVASRLNVPLADLSLAWLLHQPAVTSVLAGASRPDQIQRNARAAAVKLSPEALRELDAATAPLKQALGPNLDPWQSQSRIR
jgi:aryl-alcohol dehydrogenase-like predicted oxidoreductase